MPFWTPLAGQPRSAADSLKRPLGREQARKLCEQQGVLTANKRDIKKLIRETPNADRAQLVDALGDLTTVIPEVHTDAPTQAACFACLSQVPAGQRQAFVECLKGAVAPHMSTVARLRVMEHVLRVAADQRQDFARCLADLPRPVHTAPTVARLADMANPAHRATLVAALSAVVPSQSTDDWSAMRDALADLAPEQQLPVARAVADTGAPQLGVSPCMRVTEALAAQPESAGELAQHVLLLGLRGHAQQLVEAVQILARCPATTRADVVRGVSASGAFKALAPRLLVALASLPESRGRQEFLNCLATLDAPELTLTQRRGLLDALGALRVCDRLGVTQTVMRLHESIAPADRAEALGIVAGVPPMERHAVVAALQQIACPALSSATALACLQTLAQLPTARRGAIVASLVQDRQHTHYAAHMPTILSLAARMNDADLAAFLPCSQTLLRACADPSLLRATANALTTLPQHAWPELTAEAVALQAPGPSAPDSQAFARKLAIVALRVGEKREDRAKFDVCVLEAMGHLELGPLRAAHLVKDVPPPQRQAWLTQVKAMVPAGIPADDAQHLAKWLIRHPVTNIDGTLALVTTLDPGYAQNHRGNARMANLQRFNRDKALQGALALLPDNPPSSYRDALEALREVLPPGLAVSGRVSVAQAFLQPWPRDPADVAQWVLQLGLGNNASAEEMVLAVKVARQLSGIAPARRQAFWAAAQPMLQPRHPVSGKLQHIDALMHTVGSLEPALVMGVLHAVGNYTDVPRQYQDTSQLEAALKTTRTFLAGATPEQASARAEALIHLVDRNDDLTMRRHIADALLRVSNSPTLELAQLARLMLSPGKSIYARETALEDLVRALRAAKDLCQRRPTSAHADMVRAVERVMHKSMDADDRRVLVKTLFEGHTHPALPFANLVSALVKFTPYGWYSTQLDEFKNAVRQAHRVFAVADPTLAQARADAIVALQDTSHKTETRAFIAKTMLEEMPHPTEQFVSVVRQLVQYPVSDYAISCDHQQFRTAVRLAAGLCLRANVASVQARIDAINEVMTDNPKTAKRLSMGHAIITLPDDPPPGFGALFKAVRADGISFHDETRDDAHLARTLRGLLNTPNAAERSDRADAVQALIEGTCGHGMTLAERGEILASLRPYMDRSSLLRIVGWVSQREYYQNTVMGTLRNAAYCTRHLSSAQLQQLYCDLELLGQSIPRTYRRDIFAAMAQELGTPHYEELIRLALQLQQAGELRHTTLMALLETPVNARAQHVNALTHAARNRGTHRGDPYAHVDRENVMRAAETAAVGRAITALQRKVIMPNRKVYTKIIVNYVKGLRDGKATGDLLATDRVAGGREIDNAWRALDEDSRDNDFGESILKTPELMDLLILVWRRIEVYTHADGPSRTETDQGLMRENLMMAMAECIEDDGHRVCNVGRRARFMRVLQGYCPEIVVDNVSQKTVPNILLRELARDWFAKKKVPVRQDNAEEFATQALRSAATMYGKPSTEYATFVTQLSATVAYYNLDAEVLKRLGLQQAA